MSDGKKIIDDAEDLAGKGVDAAKGALGAVGGMLGKLKDKVEDVTDDVVDGAKKLTDEIVEGAEHQGYAAKDGIKSSINAVGDKVSSLADGTGKVVGSTVDGAKAAGGAVLGAGAAAVGGLAAGAKNIGKGAVDATGKVAGGAVNTAGKVVGGTVNAGKAAAGKVGAAGAAGLGAMSGGPNNKDPKKGGFILPFLLITGIGLLGWYGLAQLGKSSGATPPPAPADASAPAAPVNAAATAAPAVPVWFGGLVDGLKAKFPWADIKFEKGSIMVAGEAPDQATKDAMMAEINKAVDASEGKGTVVVDNVTVKGSAEKPVGAALATLGDNPSIDACNKAFADTMAGRTINFETGKAAISTDSATLLNALTGIAGTCKGYKIEIAGHTDSRGNLASNMKLSQARADAVKKFWTDKKLAPDNLVAVGFGPTKPLDPAKTQAAYTKNRRTEFKVMDASAAPETPPAAPAAAPAPAAPAK